MKILQTKMKKREKESPWEPIISNLSKGAISVVSPVTSLMIINVENKKGHDKDEKTEKNDYNKCILMEYDITEERKGT